MSLTTTVEGPLTHVCPHRDEIDFGRFRLVFKGDAPELHELAERIGWFAGREISHEALTEELAETFQTHVETRWITAGLEVTCTAEPA